MENEEIVLAPLEGKELIVDIPCMKPVMGTSKVDVRDGSFHNRKLTELGNAHRMIDKFRGNIYFVYEAKAWLFWRNGAWHWDPNNAQIKVLAANLEGSIYKEGSRFPEQADHFVKWARQSQTKKTIDATVELYSNQAPVRIELKTLDTNPFLVGIDSAKQVLDLKSGITRPALREDFITKSLHVNELGESCKAIRWIEFMNQIFGKDQALINWIQRWCGYLLTGSTDEQIFVFCHGYGANGKSVLAETLAYILGDYGRAISSNSLSEMKRSGAAASPDLADLIGARLAITTETEDDVALAEALVKSLVAGDTMTVRKLYSAPIQFKPQFKLMMLGNHKPIIKGTDHGIWRRIRLIPFEKSIPESERDPDLLNKLKSEASHILAWMVEGCLNWKEYRLTNIPNSIQKATQEYQHDQNVLGRWIEDCFEDSETAEIPSKSLYEKYTSWCNENGLLPLSNIALGRKLPEYGFSYRRSNGKNLWYGLKMKSEIS